MSSQGLKSSRASRPSAQSSPAPPVSRSSSSSAAAAANAAPGGGAPSSVSSHLAMVELKQRILTSLSKLSDRDTHQIAVSDLESTIQSVSHDAIPMLLNCLFDSCNDSKPSVKKESIRLVTVLASSHPDYTFSHLTKVVAQLSRRLKDNDSGVRDACKDAVGALSTQYLRNEGVVGLFVKPLFEAMGEQSKGVQSGAASCLAKVVECAADPPVPAFQKMCPRICKLLNNPNFLAKAALLPVVSNLSQAGAIAPQSMESLLQGLHECLGSADWATRKAAAEALTALALHSSDLITDGAANTITALEGCRFDKIKPVRDSMMEALQLWKKNFGKEDGGSDEQKSVSHENENPESIEMLEKDDRKNMNPCEKKEPSLKDSSNSTSLTPDSKAKGCSIQDKAVVILKKKAPAITDKDLNPEFFQKLETQGSTDLPVEVAVPRRYLDSSNSNNEDGSGVNGIDVKGRMNRLGNNQLDEFHGASNDRYGNIDSGMASMYSKQRDDYDPARDRWPDDRINGKDSRTRALDDDKIEMSQRGSYSDRPTFARPDGQSEGSMVSNKGNWMGIQRQLLQLERQQAHLMSMLQDFMGGSHNSMVTLENRVRGLERVVEDMARDLSISSGRRGSTFSLGFEGASGRPLGKLNGFADYPSAKFGRSGDGRISLGERYAQSEGTNSSIRGRNPLWRSDVPETWDFPPLTSSKSGQNGSRRALGGGSSDGRMSKPDLEGENVGNRRAWDKGAGPVRHGEGPSARSVWQASKDEATLEAIRVAGEDGGISRTARVAIPELTAEAIGDENVRQERDPVWAAWSNAMDALQVGDTDSAYAEVLSTGDDFLLVKLMDRSGPVIDQLSVEVASEILHAIAQFLPEQNLFDICLLWIQQVLEMVLENGPNSVDIPMEVKKELLLNLHETSSTLDPSDEWEGATPEQLLLQLASAWEIDLQHHDK
ncbi:microtubule-associated protein TORTIFOLIA1 [Rhodamnia argentea]|uniref:Microtubule-associated protein TORTIFOLIA1 n=1 Tax=Rhodamnia argentea TaxID=178133 RepID=A0A8B8Q9K0_9MYRT|nr:microtubule-associated protein TORTIFOLIA1 [Rhodamnia argentea]